jgi:hypothetical protein
MGGNFIGTDASQTASEKCRPRTVGQSPVGKFHVSTLDRGDTGNGNAATMRRERRIIFDPRRQNNNNNNENYNNFLTEHC